MIQKFHNLILQTDGQKLYDFTNKTLEWIKKNNFKNGIIKTKRQRPQQARQSRGGKEKRRESKGGR